MLGETLPGQLLQRPPRCRACDRGRKGPKRCIAHIASRTPGGRLAERDALAVHLMRGQGPPAEDLQRPGWACASPVFGVLNPPQVLRLAGFGNWSMK